MNPEQMTREADRCEQNGRKFEGMGEIEVAKVWFAWARDWRERAKGTSG